MKLAKLRVILITLLVVILATVVTLIATAPMQPTVVIQVSDTAGKPVADAIIRPERLRPRQGFDAGNDSWSTLQCVAAPAPVVTDQNGQVRVAYSRYVFEKVETGQISFFVNHPHFVPDRSVRNIFASPLPGAPLRDWANYWWDRIRHKPIIVQTEPVILQTGATLKILVGNNPAAPKASRLFAQISADGYQDTNYWIRPGSGGLLTHRLAAGERFIRAFQTRFDNSVWFSDVLGLEAVANRTNFAFVMLRSGVAVHGHLDEAVPRPVKNGRAIAKVWANQGIGNLSLEWHAWTKIGEDGSFNLPSLPQGNMEIVALCDGFVSTNGPGELAGVRYPQKYSLKTEDVTLTIGMEPTARLEVHVADDDGKSLAGATVSAWPKIRYGESLTTFLASDCYNTLDWHLHPTNPPPVGHFQPVPDFQATSDSAGVAVIASVPAGNVEFGAEHSRFVLPAILTPDGSQIRQAIAMLMPGQTNRVSVRLERRK